MHYDGHRFYESIVNEHMKMHIAVKLYVNITWLLLCVAVRLLSINCRRINQVSEQGHLMSATAFANVGRIRSCMALRIVYKGQGK